MFLRNLIVLLIIFVPNQLHFPTSIGITGLNTFNLLLILALFAAIGSSAKPGVKPPLRGAILWYIAALVYGYFVSLGSADSGIDDFIRLKTAVAYPLLFFVVYNGTPDLKTARLYLGVLFFVLLLMSVEILREVLAVGGFGTNKRFAGPFGHGKANANYAGTYLAMFVPMAAAVAIFYSKNFKVRVIAAGVAALGTFANFFTFSRASLLAIGLSILLLAIVRSRVLGVLVLVAAVNYTIWAPEGVERRVDETTVESEMGVEEFDSSVEARFMMWGIAGEIMRQYPLGIGLNKFKTRSAAYINVETDVRDAHNHFLLIGAELGVIGLLIFIWLWIGFARIGMRLVRLAEENEAKALGYGYVTALIGLMIGNTFNSVFFSGELMGNFWVLTAIVIRYTQLRQLETSNEEAPHGKQATERKSAPPGANIPVH